MKWATAFIAFDGCRPCSRAQTYFLFVILGFRSQSLAPPRLYAYARYRGLRLQATVGNHPLEAKQHVA